MKKLTLALVAALSLSTAVFAEELPSAASTPAEGQIKFTGMVTTAGCTIVPNGSNANIALGSVPVNSLKGGKTSPWASGVIKFEGCSSDADTPVKILLSVNPGTPMGGNTDAWANEGDAKDVGINVEIGGKDGFQKVRPTGTETPFEANAAVKNGNIEYKVRGQMVGGSDVKAGSVAATLSFTAEYK